MKLSNKSIYGVRAAFDLAYFGPGQSSQIKDIAERQGIPPRFLEQIFQDLKRAGIVTSKRGPKGGYQLARDPGGVRVGDIVRAVEDGVVNLQVAGDADAPEDPTSRAVTEEMFQSLAVQIERCFDDVTLASLCDRGEALGVRRGPPHRYSYSI